MGRPLKVVIGTIKVGALLVAQSLFPGVANLIIKEWKTGVIFMVLFAATFLANLEYGGFLRHALIIIWVLSVAVLLASKNFWRYIVD